MPLIFLVYLCLPATWVDRVVPSLIRRSILDDSILMQQTFEQQTFEQQASVLVDGKPECNSNTDVHSTGAVAINSECLPSVGASAVHCVPSWVNMSQWWLILAVLLKFGLASPLLLVCVSVESCLSVFVWIVTIRRFLDMHENTKASPVVSDDTSAPEDEAPSPPPGNQGCHAGSSSNLIMVIAATGMFWSIFFVDIVGDVYVLIAGGLMVLAPSLGCVALCILIMSWLQPAQSIASHTISGLGAGMASS